MARRRRRSSTASAARIIRVPQARAAAPIIKVSAPRAPATRKRARRRRSGSRSMLGGLSPSSQRIGMAVGGALFGFAVKSGWVQKLPAIPLIGRTGTAAFLLDFWARRGGGSIVANCATAAAVLAGYQLGSTGAITGDHLQSAGYDGYDYAESDFDTAGYDAAPEADQD